MHGISLITWIDARFLKFLGIFPVPNLPQWACAGRKVMTVEYYQLAICVAAEAVSANKVPEELFKQG